FSHRSTPIRTDKKKRCQERPLPWKVEGRVFTENKLACWCLRKLSARIFLLRPKSSLCLFALSLTAEKRMNPLFRHSESSNFQCDCPDLKSRGSAQAL